MIFHYFRGLSAKFLVSEWFLEMKTRPLTPKILHNFVLLSFQATFLGITLFPTFPHSLNFSPFPHPKPPNLASGTRHSGTTAENPYTQRPTETENSAREKIFNFIISFFLPFCHIRHSYRFFPFHARPNITQWWERRSKNRVEQQKTRKLRKNLSFERLDWALRG